MQSQKMEALGTLAGGIAHDFNNILASVMGYTELAIQKGEMGDEIGHDLAQVLKSAERAKALVRQILTFSRKMEPELKPLDLNREILHYIDLLKSLMPKMVSIQTRLAERPAPGHGRRQPAGTGRGKPVHQRQRRHAPGRQSGG